MTVASECETCKCMNGAIKYTPYTGRAAVSRRLTLHGHERATYELGHITAGVLFFWAEQYESEQTRAGDDWTKLRWTYRTFPLRLKEEPPRSM